MVKDAGSYTIIIYIGTLVASGHDYRSVGSVLTVTLLERLDEFLAGECFDVGETLASEFGKLEHLVVLDELAQHRGVPEDAGFLELTDNLGQLELRHFHPITLKHRAAQGRALFLADRRKLCRIAHQHESAALAGIDVVHQIVEQTASTKDGCVVGIIRNHRRLIHDEQSILPEVDIVLKDIHVRDRLLAVDLPVYSVCWNARVGRQHLGCPAGWGKQHDPLLQHTERPHQGCQQRSLARAGISFQEENRITLS